MSVSGNVVRLLQAQKLLFNIEASLKRSKETLKADPLWTKFIQTIETILEENCIDEDIIERLRSKKSRLELEIAKLQIKKLATPPPTPPRKTHFNTEGEGDRRESHIAAVNVGTINKSTLIENVEDKEVDDKVSGEKIQKLLQQQKVVQSVSNSLCSQHELGYSFERTSGRAKNKKCIVTRVDRFNGNFKEFYSRY